MSDFVFNLGQSVRIVAIDLPGKILGRAQHMSGDNTYRTVWWADNQRRDEWLLAHEIEERPL